MEPAPSLPAITWVGHATVLIELDGMRLLTDPVLGARVGPLIRLAAPADAAAGREIDAVLLSHLHADHADVPSLRRLGTQTRVIAPAGAGAWLAGRGFANVEELAPGGETSVGGVRIEATSATHDGRRRPFGAVAEPVGFVARGSRSLYFAGDTDLFDDMAALAGSIDLALLPVWGWGPRLGPGHLDPERATTAALRIEPAVAVPVHWGTFALTRPARRPRDPQAPARRFSELMAARAPQIAVRVLAPGARMELYAGAGRRAPRCGAPPDEPVL
jgi:L-ascorbate metabolism protein UlaG (beta-lactamase superfamily)